MKKLIFLIPFAIACTVPTMPESTSAEKSSPLADSTYLIANNTKDPFYVSETAPCIFRVSNNTSNGTSYINVLFVNSQPADVYSGIFDATGTLLLQQWHNGIYQSGINSIRIEWQTSLQPKIVAIGGFVNGILYRSDNCSLIY